MLLLKVKSGDSCGFSLTLNHLRSRECRWTTGSECAQGCQFDESGYVYYEIGDWISQLQCIRVTGIFTATLEEFTLNDHQGYDYYDVSDTEKFDAAIQLSDKEMHGIKAC
jgi:hypothetical protein